MLAIWRWRRSTKLVVLFPTLFVVWLLAAQHATPSDTTCHTCSGSYQFGYHLGYSIGVGIIGAALTIVGLLCLYGMARLLRRILRLGLR